MITMEADSSSARPTSMTEPASSQHDFEQPACGHAGRSFIFAPRFRAESVVGVSPLVS